MLVVQPSYDHKMVQSGLSDCELFFSIWLYYKDVRRVDFFEGGSCVNSCSLVEEEKVTLIMRLVYVGK